MKLFHSTCAVRAVMAFALGVPACHAAGPDLFVEVTVQDRFFGASLSSPTLNVRTREEVMVDAVVYGADGVVAGHYQAGAPGRRHQLKLEKLPPVSHGLYTFCLAARNASGQRQAIYPSDPGGGEEIKPTDCRLNQEKEVVEYSLPRAAYVRVRAGLREGPYLQPVLAWEAQPAGRHAVSWSKGGAGGLLREMAGHPDLQATVLGLSLPGNVLVDREQQARGAVPASARPEVVLTKELTDLAQMPWPGIFSRAKTRSGILIAEDYRLTLRVETDPAQRLALIRLDCDERDRARLLNQRYEIMLFLDGLFITEDEEALLPFNYRMSTRGIPPGRHLLTVNVLDTGGVPGTVSASFTVAPAPKTSP
jgi:hypothetical protein